MRIGDSTDYEENTKCADIAGDGYYTCDTLLSGKYVTIHATGTSITSYNWYCWLNVKAFPSKNLVADASLILEPTSTAARISFSDHMTVLNPRTSIISSDNAISPQTCSSYPKGDSDASERWFTFQLDAAYSIEYIQAVGESWDG